MKKRFVVRLLVSSCLVGSYFLLPEYGFTSFSTGPLTPSDLLPHLFYPLSHANIWHLIANILCLWMLRCPTQLAVTYAIAVICSFLPSFSIYEMFVSSTPEPTMGFSGILFAMVGISWGRIRRFKDMIVRNKWILIIPAFIPHINFLIHIYCLLAGYAYGKFAIPKFRNPEIICAKKSAN